MTLKLSLPRTAISLPREHRVWLGAALLLMLLFIAVSAPWLAPHGPNATDLMNTALPPAWDALGNRAFPLGTDTLGRDILSRLMYSARITVVVATVAPLGAAALGTILALIGGYFGGRIDALILRIVDVWMSFPAVVFAMILMAALSPGIWNVVISIIVVDWTRFCRILRSDVVVVRRMDYIAAARLAGATHTRAILRDVVPGISGTFMTLFSMEMGIGVIAESVLSFVGMSVPGNVPTWGVMIADGLGNVFSAPLALAAPIICTILTILATTLLGEGLRRTFDAKMLQRNGEGA